MQVQTFGHLSLAGSLLLAAGAIFAQSPNEAVVSSPTAQNALATEHNASILMRQARAIFGVLPSAMPQSDLDTPEMIALGEKLYFEKGMSINKRQACNDCHGIGANQAGVDNRPTSPGALNKFGDRNAPTVHNAGFQISQFWDGRAPSLEEQAKGPPLNPIEMGMESGEAVAARVKQLKTYDYGTIFKNAFPGQTDPVTFDNIVEAIAAYERTIISRNRFDDFIAGNEQALTEQEKVGLDTFINVGCVQCHSGPLVGGMMYQKVGKFSPYANVKDLGRFAVTKREADKYVFKVPQLRNIALTAPYFHDGKVKTLAEAIDKMGVMQLDVKLSDEQIRSIMYFLTSLSDKKLTTADGKAITQSSDTDQRHGIIKLAYTAQESAAASSGAGNWNPPRLADIPAGKDGDQIRLGHSLLSNSYELLGAGANDPKMRLSGSTLACTNCHQNNGTKQFGLSWVGVAGRYPVFRARSGAVGTLMDRINGCMVRSMNGKPLAEGSAAMQAMLAYMNWLSEGVPKDAYGAKGSPPFDPPNRKADIVSGKSQYLAYCSSCHGSDGAGYRSVAAGNSGPFVAPALWGDNSYNIGAGMGRLLTIAAFLKGNMPLGTPYTHPVLTDAQAYDIGAYVNSQPRPSLAGLDKDYPDKTKKPVDTPYGPYADGFSQEQHKYGPYAPILKARANAN